MPSTPFVNLVAVAAIGFLAPLLLGLLPRFRLPAVVLEIVAGIVVGPALLGWVRVDLAVQIVSVLGLAFLLFLAGMEIDLEQLRGRTFQLAAAGFLVSILIALAAGAIAYAGGLVRSPLLLGIILLATSLGLVVPVLKDAKETSTAFGQLVIGGASIADFGAVILLSLFFSREASSPGATVILLAGFLVVTGLLVVSIRRLERLMRFSGLLLKLQDTTAEIRVRAAILLLVVFVALAQRLGLETILAAFLAGATLRLIDRDQDRTHPNFRIKLEAIGYGFLIPVFFVSSGLQFDLRALFSSSSTLLRLPIFLLALLAVRGLPALLYLPTLGRTLTIAAGSLQATSLPFIVAATAIGIQLNLMSPATAAALVGAGLLSVVLFPVLALALIHRAQAGTTERPVLQSAKAARRGGTDG